MLVGAGRSLAGPAGGRVTVFALIQNLLKSGVLEVQEYVRLQIATARAIFSRPFYWHDVVEQFEQIGIGSLTVVVLAGFFTGAVLALQTGITLDQFGARPFVGRLISASMVKELGPVLTGLMLAGRVGSGIAAELGSMVVTDQINALRALGTDPVRKLVVPRVLAGLIMAPILTVIADTVGIRRRVVDRRVPAARRVQRLLDVDHRRPLHRGRLDGPDQAVRPRLRHRDHRLSRRAPDLGRHPGRRPRDDQRRRRGVGGRDRRGLLHDPAPDYADVLTADER